jgi:hypothetical protein
MIVPTAEEDKEYQGIKRDEKGKEAYGVNAQFQRWFKRQKEDLPDIKDVKTWAIFQLTTFNWLNLGVVLLLFLSLQTLQKQSSQNTTDVKTVAGLTATVKTQLDSIQGYLVQSQTLLDQVQSTADSVSETADMFSKDAQSKMKEFATINKNASSHFLNISNHAVHMLQSYNHSISAHIESISGTTISSIKGLNRTVSLEMAGSLSNLKLLNQSASHLYNLAEARLGSPVKQTVYTSGSGVFHLSTNPKPLYLKVRMVGGGAGGANSCLNGGNQNSGVSGGSTTFGTNGYITAEGGDGNEPGGSGQIGAGATGYVIKGGAGASVSVTTNGYPLMGGAGGSTPFGVQVDHAYAIPNSGTGGSGGRIIDYSVSNPPTGKQYVTGYGGGGGGYVEAVITNPSSLYSYQVGAGGAGANPSGNILCCAGCCEGGMDGQSGLIIVEEYFS